MTSESGKTQAPCLSVSPTGNPCDKEWGHRPPHHFAYRAMWETWRDASADWRGGRG